MRSRRIEWILGLAIFAIGCAGVLSIWGQDLERRLRGDAARLELSQPSQASERPLLPRPGANELKGARFLDPVSSH